MRAIRPPWANVVRWELRPRLFLRSSEFLWQEGHTAHATRAKAHADALKVLDEVYADAMTRELAIPVFRGRETEREKFAGAEISWSSQTSWSASTRLLGAMIMVHGDDQGLRVRAATAPTQVIVLTARAGEGVLKAAETLVDDLRRVGVRVEPDDRLDISLGRRIVNHELRGVPLRIELGPTELAGGEAVLARRVRTRRHDSFYADWPSRYRTFSTRTSTSC